MTSSSKVTFPSCSIRTEHDKVEDDGSLLEPLQSQQKSMDTLILPFKSRTPATPVARRANTIQENKANVILTRRIYREKQPSAWLI